MSVSRDVTEQRAADAALRAAEERSRTAFESAPIGMALVDLQGRPVRVNDAFCAVTGYERDQLLAWSQSQDVSLCAVTTDTLDEAVSLVLAPGPS